jgi:acid stress chaperone HdeA
VLAEKGTGKPVRTEEGNMDTNFRRITMGIAAAALIGGATGAFAEATKKPLGKMTCEDFLAVDDTFKPKLVYYAVAYAQGGKPEAAVIDVEGTDKITPALIEECKAAPKESFWKKLKAEVKKIEKKM